MNSFADLKLESDKFLKSPAILMIKRMEIPKLVLFGVKCFNCDTTKLCFRNSPAWNKDDILIPMFIGTPCIYVYDNGESM